jgi:hypothetical protein
MMPSENAMVPLFPFSKMEIKNITFDDCLSGNDRHAGSASSLSYL